MEHFLERFEVRYEGVLKNVETAVVAVYREEPELCDADVEAVLEALLMRFGAERQGRARAPGELTGARARLYAALAATCEWRLGREPSAPREGGWPAAESVSLEEVIACLKRIRKSVRSWSRLLGGQGYLTFVRQYVP